MLNNNMTSAVYLCLGGALRIDGDLRDFYRRLRERGQTRQGSHDRGGAQATDAAQRRSASRHSLDETVREHPPILSGRIGLISNTDTTS